MEAKPRTQKEVAHLLGCSIPFVSQWKKGKKGLKTETAIKWGEALGLPPEKILFSEIKDRPRLLGLKN